jgi:hypothetical protein
MSVLSEKVAVPVSHTRCFAVAHASALTYKRPDSALRVVRT